MTDKEFSNMIEDGCNIHSAEFNSGLVYVVKTKVEALGVDGKPRIN